MEKGQLKERIIDFIAGQDQDYFGFWGKAYPQPYTILEDRMLNKIKTQHPQVYRAKREKRNSYGEFTDWSEFDGIKYSFLSIKSFELNGGLRDIVDVLSELSEVYEKEGAGDGWFEGYKKSPRYRFKQLRTNFYEALKSPNWILADVDLYNKAAQKMEDNLKRVERLVERHERKVLIRSFDSIGFEARSKEDAQRILEDINLDVPLKMHLKFYPRLVHFENFLVYLMEDGTVMPKLLNLNERHLGMELRKSQIARSLFDKDYKKAYELAMTTPPAEASDPGNDPLRFRKAYVKCLIDNFENIRKSNGN